ncbi:1-deoxyxylulose-5-phosphate synthase YajO-like [Oscarella lobularis]|uniref:1-deoxyxylulose-5-phosphate synthase YajO-like n=1 Tax=Oscarella lobularis TaxID=121494 RepID=UPI0033143183
MSLPLRYLGDCGVKVSNICLGAMTFGEQSSLGVQCDEQLSHSLLDKFVAFGGNFVDTADIYSGGNSEKIVGSWLKKQEREKIVLATKVRQPTGTSPNDVGLSRKHIMFAVEESLKRLDTPYIDLYQTHCWDDGTPLEETLSTLTDLVRCGKVRYLGLSNVTGWQLQKIIDLTKTKPYEPFVSLQVQYSLMCRQTEWELQDVCKREGLGILPWSPLKGGWLTGKMTRDGGAPADSRAAWADEKKRQSEATPGFSTYSNDEKVWNLLDVLQSVAKETGRSQAQVAIRWLLYQSAVSSVVIGAKTLSQLEDNCAAGFDDWTLNEDQLKRLGEASDVPIPYPWNMTWRLQAGRKRDGVVPV